MRTFPRQLAALQQITKTRAIALQDLDLERIESLASEPIEHLIIEGKQAMIGLIVERVDANRLKVIVQGFVKNFIGRSMSLDGFYKTADGVVTPIPYDVLYEYD